MSSEARTTLAEEDLMSARSREDPIGYMAELIAQITATVRELTRAVEDLANGVEDSERALIAAQMRRLRESFDEFMPDDSLEIEPE